jgi:hypothetical protein
MLLRALNKMDKSDMSSAASANNSSDFVSSPSRALVEGRQLTLS